MGSRRHVLWSKYLLVLSLPFATAAAGCDSPTSPDSTSVVFPVCPTTERMTLAPNYADEISAETTPRWERFPLRLFLDAALEQYGLKQVRTGLAAWSLATRGRIGSITTVSSRDTADVVVTSVAPVGGDVGGRAHVEEVESNPSGNDIIRRARIEYSIDILERCAPLGRDVCDRIVQGIAAHEMGHVLGLSHTTFPGSLMQEQATPEGTVDPTSADVNTILIKYGCP